MKYIDIHTHQFQEDARILEIKSFSIGDDLCFIDNRKYTLGIHPWKIENNGERQVRELEKFLKQSDNILGVGECGLDFQKKYISNIPKQVQERLFVEQAYLSETYHLPLLIHCVRAYDRILQLKKQINPDMPWIIHGFSKNEKLARQLTTAGFYLSFGKQLLHYKNLQSALKKIPLHRIFFETDDARLKIQDLYAFAADLLQISKFEIQEKIADNYKSVFNPFREK